MKRRALLVGAFTISLAAVIRLALAPMRILTADEAYYLCAARRGPRAWPIDDHPPLLGALLALADRWAPGPIELRVRLVPIVLQVMTALGVARLAARLGDDDASEDRRWLLGVILATWGLLPMAGGLLATPDAPMLAALAWLVALLAEPRVAPRHELVLRACVLALAALAVAAKATALPFTLVIAAGHGARRDGPSRGRGIALALGAVAALPVTLTSLHAQLAHVVGQGPKVAAPYLGPLAAAGVFVVGQALLLGPAVVLVVLDVARRRSSDAWSLPPGVALATGLVLLAALASALVTGRPPEPNWTAPAAIAIFAVTAVGIAGATRRRAVAVLGITTAPTLLALAAWSVRAGVLPGGADPLARLPRVAQTFSAADARVEGPYAGPSWRCVYENECVEIDAIFSSYR